MTITPILKTTTEGNVELVAKDFSGSPHRAYVYYQQPVSGAQAFADLKRLTNTNALDLRTFHIITEEE